MRVRSSICPFPTFYLRHIMPCSKKDIRSVDNGNLSLSVHLTRSEEVTHLTQHLSSSLPLRFARFQRILSSVYHSAPLAMRALSIIDVPHSPPLFSFPFPATTAEAKRRPFRRKAKDEEGEWKRKKKRARLRCTFPVSLQGPIKRHKKGPPLSQLNAETFLKKGGGLQNTD